MSQRGYRKVLCDRTLPTCTRCARAGRRCDGYGTRLSWPREGDARRAVIGPAPIERRRYDARHFVNTSTGDIEMHALISGVDFGYATSGQNPTMRQLILNNLENQPTESMQVFQPVLSPAISLASYSLMAFGHDASKIREVLVRMALSDNSPCATAILKSALALASYHRDRDHSHADRLKIAALRALAASTQGVIGADESIRHVAAGMLLCTLEIYQMSAASSHWLWYVCGSKLIIKNAKLDEITGSNDMTTLIGWVHYSDVLARFSLRHWQPDLLEGTGSPIGAHFEPFRPTVCAEVQPAHLVGPPHEVLYLLSEVCDAVVEPSDPRFHTHDYQQYLKLLEWKLRKIDISTDDNNTLTDGSRSDSDKAVELYQLATLIYLKRASPDNPKERSRLPEWIERSFEILSQLEHCQRPFPLLILGCEARTDDQRAMVLDLISRTERSIHFRNPGSIKMMIQRIWVQNDLIEEEFNYVHKLGVVLSSANRSIPALV
ncbi:uncharacterized protein NECHADRAFT_73999 [Fusarium vanettenii 77-13-4]|uniref:Zn(2)-C6 fungal-type domain-containing protein n=1 Tax=Fusarium vanettenii (strain ATCC MYA-4622 / CBS 123669 / FGSC 9596 / NRRL 45880 / 77-13-4) TaxID=660122 RepID=C7YVL5_FUSV7|nr:uncharacterized protein NECHADRAFT_73999 [Fusarium vanettenii 77-13-4]EEU43814.1 hypothetical protein NECHADRAFT_73999 [Fusarium vanettenii 77-13-4]